MFEKTASELVRSGLGSRSRRVILSAAKDLGEGGREPAPVLTRRDRITGRSILFAGESFRDTGMHRHHSILLLACIAFAVLAACAKPPAESPEDFVRAFYGRHFANHQRWDLAVQRERTRFAPELLALLDEDMRRSRANPNEVVGLDFDPITDAQEDSTGFQVTGSTREGKDAIVSVAVSFGAEKRQVRVRVTPAGTAWQIANILYDEGDLVSILKELQS